MRIEDGVPGMKEELKFQIGSAGGTSGGGQGRSVLTLLAREEFASCCGVNLAVSGCGLELRA